MFMLYHGMDGSVKGGSLLKNHSPRMKGENVGRSNP